MWGTIDAFLNEVSEGQNIPRAELTMVVDLVSGGPTVFPDTARNEVDKSVTAGPDVRIPSGGYDSLGSKHLEFRVTRNIKGKGKTTIPTVLYSFQHHPLAGCCRFALNRWVRSTGEWSKELSIAALNFRREIARRNGYHTLFVSSGPSGAASGELYDEFEKLYQNGSNGLFAIKTS